MKQGRVHIQLNKDKQIAVSVGSALDDSYANLFEAACNESHSDPSSIEIGLKVVIFGSFLLEALCNRYLRELLKSHPLPPAVSSDWKAIERKPTKRKFSVVAEFYSGDAGEVLKSVHRVFEIRNSLAHFNESYDEVAGPYPLDRDLDEWVEELPETKLVTLLTSPTLESTIQDIVCAKAWLDKVYESVFGGSRRKIDLTRE